MNFSLEEEIFDNALNIFMISFCSFIYIIRLIVFCIGVYACICVCMYVFYSRMEKMVSDFKHSKSFRGTFITSRVSTTVLQLVLVSLCFFLFLMASAYSYSVHVSFRYKSLRFQPGQTYSLHLFCC